MKTNDFSALIPSEGRLPVASRTRPRENRPGLGMALLGAVCVVGVFGLLGLLYSFG